MDFHIKLREQRQKRGLTQERIAERLDIKRSTYAKYETGENQPDYEMLEKMADFFNVSTDYLLGRKKDNKEEPKFRESFNPLEEIYEFIKDLGIESIGFFDINKWKSLSPEDVEDIKKHFEWIAHKANERNNLL